MVKNYESFKRCFHTHKPLPIGDYVIYGGSCSEPTVHDADIYVGFDLSMSKDYKAYPWNEGESFLFYIRDQGIPADVSQFIKLIDYLKVQLTANKKVHVGCIGGHGRTGLVLSALVSQMMPDETDPILYVRKNYCEKAVESQAQVDFLVKEFACKAVEPRHMHSYKGYSGVTSARSFPKATAFEFPSKKATNYPIFNKPSFSGLSLWGANAVIEFP